MKDGWPVPAMFKAQKHAIRQQAKLEIKDLLSEELDWQSFFKNPGYLAAKYMDTMESPYCLCETCQIHGYHD